MELIKIIEREGRQLVSGRELHEFLEIRTKYKDWFRRMVEYGFEEEIDFIRVAQKRATNNLKNPVTTVIDHAISIDMAKEISMIQRTEKGKVARQYFINCEKKLKEVKKLSPMELMELQFKALKEQKEKISQVENRVDKLEEDMPLFQIDCKEIQALVRKKGIETLGGVATPLIERNTTIPAKKSQVFSTAADGQTSVEIHVVQGERQMASDNKTLGRFTLSGIAPAPRGIPQIEVTFDIDANGIVKVSAMDKGTGKEANITITASTNLSEEEVDKAVKEAEKFAEEDKKRKESIETKNNADQLAYQTEKQLEELGDKVSADDKAKITAKLDALKAVKDGEDLEVIKKATEELTQEFYAISSKMYADAQGAAGAQGAGFDQNNMGGNAGTGATHDDNVVDADFEVKDDK